MLGTPGTSGVGFGPVTASARSLPLCFLASSVNSLNIFAGTEGWTTTSWGATTASVIGAKSRIGS